MFFVQLIARMFAVAIRSIGSRIFILAELDAIAKMLLAKLVSASCQLLLFNQALSEVNG